MKPYLDSLDSYYSISHEPKQKQKPKKDYAGIGAVIFTFTVISIVIGLSIYTFIQIAYGQPVEFKTYTNNGMNFSIQYPSNWMAKVDQVESFPEVDFIQGEPSGLGFLEVGIHKVEPYLDTDTMTLKNTSVQQYAQQHIDAYLSPDEIIRQNKVTVGENYPGSKIEYKQLGAYNFAIFTIANGKLYTLEYMEDPLKVPETLPLINKMVESFQVGVIK
jgi:hypothetical protein